VSRRTLFLRLLVKAAWIRKDRTLTALLSILVVATIATVALTVYSDLEVRLSHEFSSFGANVVLTRKQGSLSPDELHRIDAVVANRGEIVPVAYTIASLPDNSRVVVGGADLEKLKKLNSWWSMESSSSGTALVGSRVAEKISTGSPFAISFGGHQQNALQLKAVSVFRSGSEDDSRIYIDLPQFTAKTGIQPNTAFIRIDDRPQEIEKKVGDLAASIPQAEVKPVRQVTAAQTAVLSKTRAVVLVASAIVIVLIVLCMVASLTSAVLERRKDFAVMKALGASDRTVNVIFASEAAMVSAIGALAGFILGTGIAWWIGKANFGAAITPRLELLPAVLVGSIMLALIAATAPLKALRRIQPAGILRGE